MAMHWADRAFGWVGRKPLFFSDGWGSDEVLARALDRVDDFPAVPAEIRVDWRGSAHASGGVSVREGTFVSPCHEAFPIPPESRTALVRFVYPRNEHPRAFCIQLASTGDPGWGRRSPLALLLAKRGVASVLLENPYYGVRKPPRQEKAAVRTVLDHIAMNRATVDEARSLVRWLRERGHRHIGVAGFSMGAQMAALTTASMREPVACAALGGGDSGERVFCEGVFREGIDWDALGHDEARLRDLCKRTSVTRLPRPTFDHGAVLVSAVDDGFVPRAAALALHAHWPGAELRTMQGGHLSLFALGRAMMVSSVVDGLVRLGAPRDLSYG